jgi:hypothetical protein
LAEQRAVVNSLGYGFSYSGFQYKPVFAYSASGNWSKSTLMETTLRPSAAQAEWRERGFPCRVLREINVPGETLEPVFTSPAAVLRT